MTSIHQGKSFAARLGAVIGTSSFHRTGDVLPVAPETLARAPTRIALLLLIAPLAGCDTQPVPPPDDPAMQNTAVEEASQSIVQTLISEPAVVDSQTPTRKDGRVFFPQLGWMNERAFWEMYNNEPQQLPGSLDLHAVHQLRLEYERERENKGET